MIGLNKIGLNQVQLNQLYLNTLCACQKSSGGDGFPRLPGDVTRWSFKGLTNEQMSKNPRLEDADHKGRFLTFKNFAWGGMSGCGGYSLSKEIFSYTPDIYSFKFTDPEGGLKIFDVYFQLIGLDENSGVSFNLDIRKSGTSERIKRETYTKDGIYHFEYKSEDDATNLFMIGYNGDGGDRTTFTVKILPYYPDALVFDGVDDYGICDNFPILTKESGYTVIGLRHILNDAPGAWISKRTVSPNTGAFAVDLTATNLVSYANTFGKSNVVSINKNNAFVYQTSTSYMENPIIQGENPDNNTLVIGAGLLTLSGGSIVNAREYVKCSIHELVILDHDATEEELAKIKEYYMKQYPWLFFDQAWTVVGKSNEDTDRATIANITGNGNNLVLSNFGFAGNSGYGEYAYNWNVWDTDNGAATNVSKQYNKFAAVMPVNQSISTCSLYSPEVSIGTKFQFKLKITGLITNWIVRVMEGYTGDSNIIYEFDKDGTYQIDHTMTGSGNQLRLYIRMYCAVPNAEGTTVTVEQIPDHEGYLVTDGVDDYVRSSNDFTLGKKFTVVGEWELLDNTTVLSGIAKNVDFFLYSNINGLSFYCKQDNLPTVFNGIKSLTAFNSEGLAYDHKWEKYVCKKTGDEAPKTTHFIIGTNNNTFAKVAFKNMAMYAEKVLSKEDMIKAYIYLQTLKAK